MWVRLWVQFPMPLGSVGKALPRLRALPHAPQKVRRLQPRPLVPRRTAVGVGARAAQAHAKLRSAPHICASLVPRPAVAMPETGGVTVKDVTSHDFVIAYAAHLKRIGKIEVPKWADGAASNPEAGAQGQ